MSIWLNTGVTILRRIPVLCHRPRKSVSSNTKLSSSHGWIAITTNLKGWSAMERKTSKLTYLSHLSKAITTILKRWSAMGLSSKASYTRHTIVLRTTGTAMGTTTTPWSNCLGPSYLMGCTSRPSALPLNSPTLHTMERVVPGLVVQLQLLPSVSLPPKTKLS